MCKTAVVSLPFPTRGSAVREMTYNVVYYYDSETYEQSSQWKIINSVSPKKARVAKSTGKHMISVFEDSCGLILYHAVPSGVTVNTDYYSKVKVK